MSITRAATILLACTTARAVSIGEHDALTPPAAQLLAEFEAADFVTDVDELWTAVRFAVVDM